MAESTAAGLSTQDWMLEQVAGEGPALIVAQRAPSDQDEPAEQPGEDAAPAPDPNSGAKRSALWLGCGVLVAAAGIVTAFAVIGGGPDPVAPPQHHAPAVRAT
ncbi:hypothetical protein AN933_23960, partial [Mycobacterium intracellulare subsp. chimaera]